MFSLHTQTNYTDSPYNKKNLIHIKPFDPQIHHLQAVTLFIVLNITKLSHSSWKQLAIPLTKDKNTGRHSVIHAAPSNINVIDFPQTMTNSVGFALVGFRSKLKTYHLSPPSCIAILQLIPSPLSDDNFWCLQLTLLFRTFTHQWDGLISFVH